MFIEGTIDGMLFVSVPTGTPDSICAQVQSACAEKFKKDVIVVTHNMMFMTAERVSPKDAAKIVKMAEVTQ